MRGEKAYIYTRRRAKETRLPVKKRCARGIQEGRVFQRIEISLRTTRRGKACTAKETPEKRKKDARDGKLYKA